MTYRIHRAVTSDTVVFALSGDMDADHATRLQEFLATEANGPVTLDLRDVTLVDRAAVRFLVRVQAAGIRIINCPEYVRSWIAAESDWQQKNHQEPGQAEPDERRVDRSG